MTLEIDYKAQTITLDWDNVNYKELQDRLSFIVSLDLMARLTRSDAIPRIDKIQWRTSASKGFHVLIDYSMPVPVAATRRLLRDDGNRIIGDLFREKEHDILWDRKTLRMKNGDVWQFNAGQWNVYYEK